MCGRFAVGDVAGSDWVDWLAIEADQGWPPPDWPAPSWNVAPSQQVAIIERTLVPLVRTTTKNLNDSVSIGSKLDELMVLLHQIDAQLSIGGPSFDIEIEDDDGAATQRMPAVKGPGK